MLILKNLYKSYAPKGGKTITRALDDLTIEFPERGMVFILGKSGSGKSTLLNVAGGLDKPDGGEIIVKGRSSKSFKASDFDSYRNTYVGFIFQEYNLLNEFDVEQNIELALQLQGKKNGIGKVERILEAVDLKGMGKRKPNTLSGGQKQRVAIARALVKDPEIIMADEPTGALDSETGREVLDTLKKLSAERLVIVVTHDEEFAERYGDRIIRMKDGKVVSDEKRERGEREKIKVMREDRGPVRSRLPLTRALKLGASSLKTKPFRLILTVLIAVMAFSVFGTVSTMMLYNADYTAAKALEGTEYSSALLFSRHAVREKRTVYEYANGKLTTGVAEQTTSAPSLIPASEAGRYDDEGLGVKFAGVFAMNDDGGIYNYADDSAPQNYYRYKDIAGFTDAGENYLTGLFGADALLAGAYPANANEVAVSEYMCEVFSYYGLRSYDPASGEFGEQITIASPDDLIGRYVAVALPKSAEGFLPLKISGVYRTGVIDEKFDGLKNVSAVLSKNEAALLEEFERVTRGYHNLFYVSEDFYGEHCVPEKVGYRYENVFFNDCEAHDLDFGDSRVNFSGGSVTHFVVPQRLKAYGDKVTYYSFADGSVMPADTAETLGETETLASVYSLVARADTLLNSYKLKGLDADGKDIREEYENRALEEAVGRINCYGEGIAYDDAEFPTVSGADIRTVLSALKADWNEWVTNGPGSNKYSYGDADKAYFDYGDGYLTIKGVYVLGGGAVHRSSNYVFSRSFLNNRCDRYRYAETETRTAFVPPADGKYSAVITPMKTSGGMLKYLFGLKKPTANDGFLTLTDNGVANKSDYISQILDNPLVSWIGAGGILLAVVAALFLLNYIAVSITDKRRDIGVLRALGARGIDVFKIFLAESALIALTCAALAIIVSAIACVVANGLMISTTLGVNLLHFRFINGVIVAGIALLTALLGTVLPVALAARKAPVESIRAL